MADDTGLQEKKIPDEKPRLKGLGVSGTLVQSEMIDDEYLAELKGNAGQIIYEKMLRSDSQIRKIFHAVSNPIRSATWDVKPASDEEKDIKVAALIKHILFNNVEGGWLGKLDEILTFPWHGHAVFEVIHASRDEKPFGPYTGLLNIAFRDQRTLDKWKFQDGILKAVHQIQNGDIPVDVDLPIEFLIIFYNEKKGDDIGFPFLRMLYGNYKRKLLYKQLQAIGIERGALNVPVLKVPDDIDPESDEWKLAEEQLQSFTQAESAYFILPKGYELELSQTNTFNPANTQVAIKAENEEMVGSLVAMFLEMGIGGNSGNQAGTEVSAGFFRDGIEYLASKIAEVINQKLIPSLVRMNFGDTVETMPLLSHSGISDEAGESLMRIVTGYVEKGVITTDEQLEDHVRKIHNLPKKAAGEMVDNGTSKNDKPTDPSAKPSDDNKPNDKPAAATPPEETKLNDKEFVKALDNKGITIDFAAKESEVKSLMSTQAKKISDVVKSSVEFSGKKLINDVMNKYKQLPANKKQNATSNVVVGGKKKLKESLRAVLAETGALAIDQARKEIPGKKNVELKTPEKDLIRLSEKYGDISEIRLNDMSKLPAYIQVLIQKQADLVTDKALTDMLAKINFTYSTIETKSNDVDVLKQNMEETLSEYVKSPTVAVTGENVAALMVNEGRNSFFFDTEVLEEIHSFTFVNGDPKSAICKELAGTTFNTNDAESMRYTPPLHHNCKSYLRANLKTSKGVDKLKVKTLSPSAEAVKSITL